MNYFVEDIAKKIKAVCFGKTSNTFSELAIDSRAISFPANTLFIAIKTQRNDGHRFIEELYQKGVRSFLIGKNDIDFKKYTDAAFIVCNDTVIGLQQIATIKRKTFRGPVIGITGSNGKTIVKEWLSALLKEDEALCKSPKSWNSQIGVPLSVWLLEKRHTLGIFEAGISMPGEMEKLEKILSPEIGIITNLKSAHDEHFSSRIEKAREKLQLFIHSKTVFYCSDYQEISNALKQPEFKHVKKIGWSFRHHKNEKTALRITSVQRNSTGTTLSALFKKKKIKLHLPFADDASIENVAFCWLYLLTAGYSNSWVEKAVAQLEPIALRLEIKAGINQCTLVNDSYSSDIESLSVALDLLNRQYQHPKKVVILSDISGSSLNTMLLYQKIATLMAAKKIHRFIGVGKYLSAHQSLFAENAIFFPSTEKLLEQLPTLDFSHEAILIKGARVFQFEQIGALLQEKSHDTVFEIHLNHIIHNLNYYRSLLSPGTKVMAMVKAFSYGSGSYEIASALQHHRVDYFAVAYTDEGVALRKGGITAPIMVMNPEPGSFQDLLHYHLEPEIFSLRILQLFISFIKGKKIKRIPSIHIKIDTGMRRLGFETVELNELMSVLKKHPSISVASIFSHLVGSENPDLNDFTLQQIKTLQTAAQQISSVLKQKPLLHICNSAAIAKFPEAHLNMVRLGIGMYGVGANEKQEQTLLNAGCWKTTISQIKQLKKGETVGYNRKGITHRNTVIATVPVGYADGFSRKLSNGNGVMYLRGYEAPVIGNVCMDMCMLDITDVYEKFKRSPIREGEEIIIFDTVEKLKLFAQKSDSIPYEVLTSISPRVKRIYLTE